MNRWIHAATLSALALAVAHHPTHAQSAQQRPATELRLSDEPVLSIGLLEGPNEYLLAGINAGARLADGSVVVSDRQHFRVQRFSAQGKHLWSRGREGEGPGEFEYVRIAEGCASEESIVVYDIWSTRVYVYDVEGNLVNEYQFRYNGQPLRDFACAPGGRLGFMGSSVGMGEEGVEPGELFRALLSLGTSELGNTATTTLRERIPGREQRLLGPGDSMPGSIWAHDVVLAATDQGLWLGTSEDYEVELIGWTGETIRRIRWEGPDLAVTQEDVDRYRGTQEERYRDDDDPDWRARFESFWEWQSEIVPEEFPAYHRLLVGDDGVLWVQDYVRPGERSEWFGFDPEGRWVRTLVLPVRTYLLDVGDDWALVRTLDDLGVQRVEVRGVAQEG